MKRPWLIILGGLMLALLAYGASYFSTCARWRNMEQAPAPELAWLQQEFNLSDTELARIETLHKTYTASCAERCRLIDAKNSTLRELLKTNTTVTPEIEKTIQEAAQLRAACQTEMLRHFYLVSQSMPPAQGKRYFEWIIGRTFGSEHQSMMSAPAAATHEHHNM